MKIIFIYILLSLLCIISTAQNRKGEFRLQKGCDNYELYVAFKSDDFLFHREILETATKKISGFDLLVDEYSISMERGICISEDRYKKIEIENNGFEYKLQSLNKLKKIYKVKVPNADPYVLFKLAEKIEKFEEIDYVSLIPLEPISPPYDISPVTPDYENLQKYLDIDPGVNIRYAWEMGLTGENIRVRDVEYGVNTQHEDLNELNVSIAAGMDISPEATSNYTEHGTAVFGIVYGDKGEYGVSGMAHGSKEMILYPEWQTSGYDRVGAITRSISDSDKGDVIIFEMQTFGKNDEYVPAEYENVIWDLTKAATDAGIIIVAAAGNGNQNLDDDFYESYNSRGNSGAIIVGAGSSDTYHQRMYFSTYGSRVDVHAWGSSVFTCGYGDYTKIGNDFNQGYTYFSGTSSATPIVASCTIILQSYYNALTGDYLNCDEIRKILIETGIPQGGDITKHIGPLPNMETAIDGINEICKNITGDLNGVVVDISGNKLSGVSIKTEDGMYETKTNENGEFTLTGMPVRIYNISASKDGFISQTSKVTISSGSTTNLNFELEKNDLNIILANNQKINIYPNPTVSYTTIQGDLIHKIEVFSPNGQLIITKDSPDVDIIKIDLSGLNPGIYLLKIHTVKDKVIFKNVILQN